MMSLEDIIARNTELAAEAAREDRRPYVLGGPEELDRFPPFPFPNLGPHVPEGWESTDHTWLVDRTGGAGGSEIALSVREFRDKLRQHLDRHPDHGFAITEEGPLQVVVSALKRTRAAVVATTDGR